MPSSTGQDMKQVHVMYIRWRLYAEELAVKHPPCYAKFRSADAEGELKLPDTRGLLSMAASP